MVLELIFNDIEDTLNFMVQESPKLGIKFKPSKIKIFIGNCSKEETLERINRYQAFFSNSIPMENFSIPSDEPSTRGVEILNVPIGTDEYIKKKLDNKIEEIAEDIKVIENLDKVHNKWTYTYYVNGKLNYFYRNFSNSRLTMAAAVKFENMKMNLMEHTLMNKINNFQQFQINLGIS
jgi:hypothetical protein